MKKKLSLIIVAFLISTSLYSQTDTITVSGQIFGGYLFQENTNFYDLGLNFLAPITKNKSLFSFSGIFELNFMFGKSDGQKIWGANILPGIKWQIINNKFSIYFDLLTGFGYYKFNEQPNFNYGIFSTGRGGISYMNFAIEYGSSVFISKNFYLDKPLQSIFFRYTF